MRIVRVSKYNAALLQALNRLLPQLSPALTLMTSAQLKQMLAQQDVYLLMAVEENGYCGMLTLVVCRYISGKRARIEDVVVDGAARGKGVATQLIASAIDQAKACGARTIDLTSRPSRTAANALYRKMGFSPLETNVYLYRFE